MILLKLRGSAGRHKMSKHKRQTTYRRLSAPLPKTYTEKVGFIQTTDHFTALTVNNSNVVSACVDVKTMQDTGSSYLLLSLNKFFLDLTGPDFQSWMRLHSGGGDHVHLTIFKYWDAAHLQICKFATDFQNINVMESGCAATDLDISPLKKAVIVTKHAYNYFYGLVACGARDNSAITIAPKPLVPAVINIPAGAAGEMLNRVLFASK